MAQAFAQKKSYTESDYYNLPEDVRAELIDGQIYYQATPSRIHQEILNFLITEINIYIRSKFPRLDSYASPQRNHTYFCLFTIPPCVKETAEIADQAFTPYNAGRFARIFLFRY